jgi:hypothetical protein
VVGGVGEGLAAGGVLGAGVAAGGTTGAGGAGVSCSVDSDAASGVRGAGVDRRNEYGGVVGAGSRTCRGGSTPIAASIPSGESTSVTLRISDACAVRPVSEASVAFMAIEAIAVTARAQADAAAAVTSLLCARKVLLSPRRDPLEDTR